MSEQVQLLNLFDFPKIMLLSFERIIASLLPSVKGISVGLPLFPGC